MVLSPSYFIFCFHGLSGAFCPFPYVLICSAPPLPNSQEHSGAGSAIVVVSFRLKLQGSPTRIVECLLHTDPLFLGASALVQINVDSLNYRVQLIL